MSTSDPVRGIMFNVFAACNTNKRSRSGHASSLSRRTDECLYPRHAANVSFHRGLHDFFDSLDPLSETGMPPQPQVQTIYIPNSGLEQGEANLWPPVKRCQ